MKSGRLQIGVAMLAIAAYSAVKAAPSVISGTVGGPCFNGVFESVATFLFGVPGLACAISACLPPRDGSP